MFPLQDWLMDEKFLCLQIYQPIGKTRRTVGGNKYGKFCKQVLGYTVIKSNHGYQREKINHSNFE